MILQLRPSLPYQAACTWQVQPRILNSSATYVLSGVWRRKTIETAGGWNSRTTVEDMDLSLRAYMAGWKAIYLRDVTVLNEVSRMCDCMLASGPAT